MDTYLEVRRYAGTTKKAGLTKNKTYALECVEHRPGFIQVAFADGRLATFSQASFERQFKVDSTTISERRVILIDRLLPTL